MAAAESDAFTILRVLRDKYVGWAFQHEIAERGVKEGEFEWRFLSNSECVAEWGRNPPRCFEWHTEDGILSACGVVVSILHKESEVLCVNVEGERRPCSEYPTLIEKAQSSLTTYFDWLYLVKELDYMKWSGDNWVKVGRPAWQLSFERIIEGYPPEHWDIVEDERQES
jgi:hypothetical protein